MIKCVQLYGENNWNNLIVYFIEMSFFCWLRNAFGFVIYCCLLSFWINETRKQLFYRNTNPQMHLHWWLNPWVRLPFNMPFHILVHTGMMSFVFFFFWCCIMREDEERVHRNAYWNSILLDSKNALGIHNMCQWVVREWDQPRVEPPYTKYISDSERCCSFQLWISYSFSMWAARHSTSASRPFP